jgi:hypothetical protein
VVEASGTVHALFDVKNSREGDAPASGRAPTFFGTAGAGTQASTSTSDRPVAKRLGWFPPQRVQRRPRLTTGALAKRQKRSQGKTGDRRLQSRQRAKKENLERDQSPWKDRELKWRRRRLKILRTRRRSNALKVRVPFWRLGSPSHQRAMRSLNDPSGNGRGSEGEAVARRRDDH